MANLQQVVYLSQSDYQTLVNNGTLTKTVNNISKTITYNQNALYIVPEEEKILNDSTANWASKSNYIPDNGVIILYNDLPGVKIGDGTTTVDQLPFITANKVSHTLTFGNGGVYTYDGSADVTVPVYTGTVF